MSLNQGAALMAPLRIAHFSPARILLLSALGTIIIGAVILSLPMCRNVYIPFFDLLFTSTSATCVAGFSTVPLENFTKIGQLVLLIQIQIGGLGLVTLTLFLMSLFVRFNFSTQLIAGQLLDLDSWRNIKKVIFFIIGFTALLECIGALFIFSVIHRDYTIHQALFLSLFHAVSGFCHAGFSLFPHNFIPYQNSPLMLIPLSIIILASSLGFLVWYELLHAFWQWVQGKRCALSLHTRVVLFISVVLIVIGTILFFFVEYNNTLRDLPFLSKIINAFFNTVCARGTGFTTFNMVQLQYATLLLVMVLAFIGSSPGSPGSGIKTTTFAVLCATIKSAIVDRSSVFIYGRRIPVDQVHRTLAIIALSIAWIMIALFILLITDANQSFIAIFFELVSAFSTLGLSTGITYQLSSLGKYLIMITMIFGRIGSLAFFLALFKLPRKKVDFTYPEERIMLG